MLDEDDVVFQPENLKKVDDALARGPVALERDWLLEEWAALVWQSCSTRGAASPIP